MRTTTILGLILGFGTIYLIIRMDGSIYYFANWEAFVVVTVGTIASMIVYFSPFALKSAFKVFLKLLTEKPISSANLVELMVYMSKKARRVGFIELYQSSRSLGLPFLEKGLMLLADGVDIDNIQDLLLQDSNTIYIEQKTAERFFRVAGSFSPLFGILGTVMGLISMLNNIKNPAAIPSAMGLALVTTFYGIIFSALFFKPVSGKIREKAETERQKREIIINGILDIHRGENSQRMKEKLTTFVNV